MNCAELDRLISKRSVVGAERLLVLMVGSEKGGHDNHDG